VDDTVIYEYSLEQAIADGVLVEVFKNRWKQLSGGKPIVATSHLFSEVSLAGLMEIWNEYAEKRQIQKFYNPEPFVTKMNGKNIWVIEDGVAFTMMYPEDY